MKRTIVIAVAALAALAAGPPGIAHAAVECVSCTTSLAPAQETATSVVEVAPTSTDLAAAAEEDAAEGITSTVALHCYHQYAWEKWDTRGASALYFYNRITHWCGRAGVHIYKRSMRGFADWYLPIAWREEGDSWTKGWVDNRHLGVHTTALATLYLDQAGFRLETKRARLCLDVFANGNAKVTCHN